MMAIRVMTGAFIAVLLLFMWCWDYPADHPSKKFCRLFAFPFLYFGLWHGWSMFAPEPIHVNRRLRALLTFDNGSIEEWCPLGPDECSPWMKMLIARSFKFENSILGSNSSQLYSPLCEFLLRQCQSGDSEPRGRRIHQIELIRDFRLVNPMGSQNTWSEMKSVPFFRFDAVAGTGRILVNSVNAANVPARVPALVE